MRPKRYKPKRRIRPKRSLVKKFVKSRLFWFVLAGVCILGATGYGVFFTPWLQVKDIEVQGNQRIEGAALAQVARAHLARRMWFLSTTHFLLADSSTAARAIQEAFPAVETVVAKKKFPDSLMIVVHEREGVAVWCQEKTLRFEVQQEREETVRSFRECYAIDKHGVAFEEKDPDRELVISGAGMEASPGGNVIDERILNDMLRFQLGLDTFSLFQEVGLRVSSLHIVSKERVHAKISEGWEIYFNPAEEIGWQVTKGKLVLEQEIPFQRRPFLEYIDVRFGDRAYIKYR